MQESQDSQRPFPFINMMTYLSWKAVLTVHAFTALFDMLHHGHRGLYPETPSKKFNVTFVVSGSNFMGNL